MLLILKEGGGVPNAPEWYRLYTIVYDRMRSLIRYAGITAVILYDWKKKYSKISETLKNKRKVGRLCVICCATYCATHCATHCATYCAIPCARYCAIHCARYYPRYYPTNYPTNYPSYFYSYFQRYFYRYFQSRFYSCFHIKPRHKRKSGLFPDREVIGELSRSDSIIQGSGKNDK